MNFVTMHDSPTTQLTLRHLLDMAGGKNHQTAFIGKCGDGPEHALYLIVYDAVVLAHEPHRMWSNKKCAITVEAFVDVEMIVK